MKSWPCFFLVPTCFGLGALWKHFLAPLFQARRRGQAVRMACGESQPRGKPEIPPISNWP
ncbi:MAG: hypothetical protein CMP30_09740 [Roseibacillus sp.]|nr:hypothetical protein [Roseibacillus sp.]